VNREELFRKVRLLQNEYGYRALGGIPEDDERQQELRATIRALEASLEKEGGREDE